MERRAITIEGTVQGVGFRPFVYGLAQRLQLAGFVRNRSGSVEIEIEGDSSGVERFLADLTNQLPPLARIEKISSRSRTPRGERAFTIESSDSSGSTAIAISPDVATCDDCLAELWDPRDRRYHYPFINCTNCGPRLTIVTGAPYDRARTTMAGFAMCPSCRAEYENPLDRRFHAQPIACPVCGPRVELWDAGGKSIDSVDAIAAFAAAIVEGKIGALKGLGGYHLACDATNAAAVAELRRRKHREEKPLALMVQDVAAARALCEIDEPEEALLRSPARPAVLLRKRFAFPPSPCTQGEGRGEGSSRAPSGSTKSKDNPHSSPLPQYMERGPELIAYDVAPGNPFLAIMLPYTPLHHLLFAEVHGRPLVMTSGNQSDEPIAIDEPDAIERLNGIADLFLTHNRPIHVRCDDSVMRMIGNTPSPIRRSRGYAPEAISLPMECPAPILAVGGQLKSAFALGTQRRAILSHHGGDLDHYRASVAFERDIALFEQLFSIQPQCIAHDLHPDYAATQYAMKRAAESEIRLIPVQHHHAHMASCMAEHALTGSVIGISFDGAGLGTDGAIWGGEFLTGDYRTFRRAAHLRYVPLPGGDRAAREPWRMALSHLIDAQATCRALERRIDSTSRHTVERMIEKKLNSPLTSSCGRLFDAVASLIGIRDIATFEGQAAMQLEWLAQSCQADGSYPFEIAATQNSGDCPLAVDTRPLIRAIAAAVDSGTQSATIARRFHTTLVEIIAAVCAAISASSPISPSPCTQGEGWGEGSSFSPRNNRIHSPAGISQVVLSGGVFMNTLLTEQTISRLREQGYTVYRHEKVPPNDGGLSLGQLAIAASMDRAG
ncbi:MAG: carbamoyltransferase HypF [Tepidisphaeraceae bacterium]